MGIGFAQTQLYLPSHSASHNLFVETFCESGVPGLLLCVSFLVVVLRKAWRVAHPGLRAVLVGLFVGSLIANMANPYTYAKGFWLHMSLCVLGGILFGRERLAAPAEPEPTGEHLVATHADGLVAGGAKGS